MRKSKPCFRHVEFLFLFFALRASLQDFITASEGKQTIADGSVSEAAKGPIGWGNGSSPFLGLFKVEKLFAVYTHIF